jgi:HEAT repeat protein
VIKKKIFQKKLIKIIENKYVNWEQKATMLERVVLEDEIGVEFFKDLILTHKKPKIRKGAASILGYIKNSDLPKELISRILDEKDWTVRYALSNACVKHMKNIAVEKLIADYENRIKSVETSEKHKLNLIFTESLGYMELKEAEPILTTMLKEIGTKRDQKSIELIIQILYSLGEVGDKSTVELLIHYSADNRYTTKGIRNSAVHAIDKIAKRLRFSSKKALLDSINKE